LRFLGYFLANRTLALDVLPEGVDYSAVFVEPSALEQALAIWANVLDLDETGAPRNAPAARRRMAQYIRSYVDPGYTVEPPFADWELELAV
jgi:hypothetical protein